MREKGFKALAPAGVALLGLSLSLPEGAAS